MFITSTSAPRHLYLDIGISTSNWNWTSIPRHRYLDTCIPTTIPRNRYLGLYTSTSVSRHLYLDIGISTSSRHIDIDTSTSVPSRSRTQAGRSDRYLNIFPDLDSSVRNLGAIGISIFVSRHRYLDNGISSFVSRHRYLNIDPDLGIDTSTLIS